MRVNTGSVATISMGNCSKIEMYGVPSAINAAMGDMTVKIVSTVDPTQDYLLLQVYSTPPTGFTSSSMFSSRKLCLHFSVVISFFADLPC